MLNRKEVAVMHSIYDECKNNNGSCIISDERIIGFCPEKFKLTPADVDIILKQLEYDGYFECTKSERKGQTVNVVTLKQKGKAFEREMVQRRRERISTFFWRIFYAVLGAIVALLVKLALGG